MDLELLNCAWKVISNINTELQKNKCLYYRLSKLFHKDGESPTFGSARPQKVGTSRKGVRFTILNEVQKRFMNIIFFVCLIEVDKR